MSADVFILKMTYIQMPVTPDIDNLNKQEH